MKATWVELRLEKRSKRPQVATALFNQVFAKYFLQNRSEFDSWPRPPHPPEDLHDC